MASFEITNSINDFEFIQFINSLGAETEKQFIHFRDLGEGEILQKAFQPSRHNFFLKIGGKLAGYAFLTPKDHVANFGLVIGPNFQQQGYGRLLIEYMIGEARRLGFKKIWGGCFTDNKRAIQLYHRLGFVCEGCFLNERFEGCYRHLYSLAKYMNRDYDDSFETSPKFWIDKY